MAIGKMIWHLRSGFSFWLLGIALDLAPTEEKPSLAVAVSDHCKRCVGNDARLSASPAADRNR